MRRTGLRAEILVNILFITAVAMFLIGLIGFKVTERYAIQSQIESIKAVTLALEESYLEKNDIKGAVRFLERVFPADTYGVIATEASRTPFGSTSPGNADQASRDPSILEVLNTGETEIELEGLNILLLSSYRSVKITAPVRLQSGRGAVLICRPLGSLNDSLFLSMRLIALWIIVFLVIIGSFGFYILSRRIVKPVSELIRTTEKIAEGKFPENSRMGSIEEINQLHEALKDMYREIEEGKNRLKDKIQELEDTNLRLQQTQRELIAAEKLASLGKLSAGVAHEIGNPLSAIRGYADVLNRIPDTEPARKNEIVEEIQREVNRIDVIIRSLLDYSRPKNYSIGAVDVNVVLRSSVDIVSKQGLLKNIEITTDLDENLGAARADPDQLSQVIINLILNSVDAIHENGGIAVSTSETENGNIIISVKDNGEGIPEKIIDRVFDPFYTTKEPGRGTGLGLSICLTIIDAFGGTIKVESKEGEGAKFIITLQKAA